MAAAEANYADIGAGSYHLPAVTATRVFLSELYDVTLFNFHNHDTAL